MLVTEKFLICDGCGENFGIDSREFTAKQHREAAREWQGWVYINGKDYCPNCKPNKPINLTA